MNVKVFIDSNVFLYTFTDKEPLKQNIAKALVLAGRHTISVQVVNEVSNNLLKKLGLVNADVQDFVDDCYSRYQIENLSQAVFGKAASLRERYRFSYYDSIIVSSALLSDCQVLYSEDMQHNLLVDNQLTILDPFA
ncbi:PIN domain-containing protein [Thiothrix unzii]|uniref:PIN domain-containing protein n=1 Tax=Thiothrix unzii TaxID=111769 RepID=A0A975FA87_9GAMM|nr:PIN domain-containing protein [Thiothrix unzii]QTR53911.1 PIN domain-containing protein [Thiothrix unzii]